MCNNENNFNTLLEKILLLQQKKSTSPTGCDKPFLSTNPQLLANTRPLNLYCCCTNKIWEMAYDYNGLTGTSNTFRIENINNNVATFRILASNEDTLIATDNYFMIDLDYISCVKCLNDVFIQNVELN